MDKALACFERIRVVKGVSGGIITNEQVDSLCSIFGLDEAEKQHVLELMARERIVPIPEDEVPEKLRPAPKKPPEPKEMTPEEWKQIYKERFSEALHRCKCAIEVEPELGKQYIKEVPVLKQALSDQYGDPRFAASHRVMSAAMYLSKYRVRKYRKRGWVCGTYMRSVEKYFLNWVRGVFSESELEELIACCGEGRELTQHQLEMLTVLIHKTPMIRVNLYSTDWYCGDEPIE